MTSAQPRIGIVIGSTREGRFSGKSAYWIHEIAKQRADLAVDLIDLRDHPLPFFAHLAQSAKAMLDDIAWWTAALKSVREAA